MKPKDAPATPHPGQVPCNVGINPLIWDEYEERLERLRAACPHVHMGGRAGPDHPRAKEHTWRDPWGCLWHFPGMYLDGVVVEHPLESWDRFDAWTPPSIEDHKARIRAAAETAAQQGRPAPNVHFEHGFLFLRLTYLRGFNNFMMDVAEDHPNLYRLRDIVTDYWQQVAEAGLQAGAKVVHGGDDLGLQDRLPISPDAWRRLLKPGFARIFQTAHDHGAQVSLHTDGYIVDIIPDLIEIGVDVLNPQDLVNGLDRLAALAKGKVTLALDIDRQSITVRGTPEDVDAHIRRCIETLGSPQGGLRLTFGVYPGTPIEKIEAAVSAMEAYHDLWVRR